MNRQYLRYLAAGCLSSLLAGCNSTPSLFEQRTVASHDEAGSTHIAVLSVEGWEAAKQSLIPSFAIPSGNEALDLAVPNTLEVVERTLGIVERALRIGRGTGTENTGKPGEGVSQTSKRDLPGAPDAKAVRDTVGAALKYQAATALLQEIRMLKEYINHAPSRVGFRPVLVRIQVSLQPRIDNLRYDAFLNASFFATAPAGQGRISMMENPVVIPLIATDTLEGSVRAAAVEAIANSSLTLIAVLKDAGAGASFGDLEDRLKTAAGRDLNSLFTVGRLTDNTIRARFGAAQQASSRRSMIPRTHHVTLLVLMPANSRTLRILSESEFVDVETGQMLPRRSHVALIESMRSIRDKFDLKLKCSDEDLKAIFAERGGTEADRHLYAMARFVDLNDLSAFRRCIADPRFEDGQSMREIDHYFFQYVWESFAKLRQSSVFGFTSVEIPN